MPADLDRARDALQACDPSCGRDEWVRLAMAAKAAGLNLDTFDAWSARADSYSERDTRAVWNSIRSAGAGCIGPGTLFKAAAAHGWRPEEDDAEKMPGKAPARPVERATRPQGGHDAAAVWARCKPAPADHPYIAAKDGTADRLRVVPEGDPLRVAGHSVVGWLVVPVLPLAGGEPASLQFIPPPGAGRKVNLPGASMAGAFVVGDMPSSGTVFLCEGIGQAWACWKATGWAAVVCFGWGRVRRVAAELRERDASARLVVVPDVGKEADAEAIAREVGGYFVALPEGWERNADVNDYARREGFDALDALLCAPRAPAQRFRLLGSADLHALPPLAWRVRGVLPAQGLASVYGPSGSGKSFLVLDMACAIAEGRDWFGFRVKPCPVVYVCLEGAAGFRLRVQAWERHHGRPLPAALRLVLQPFRLTEPQDVADMGAAVSAAGAGAVTVVDTLNASAPGIDENASRDMGLLVEAAKTLQACTGGLVVVVHHTGKDAARGLRGHSSLFAALDAALEVTRQGERHEWRIAKAKDGADGGSRAFSREVVELPPDSEGERVTSCVVREDSAAADIRRAKLPQGGNQKVILEALRPLFRASHATGRAGAPPQRPCLALEEAIASTAPRLTCPPDRRAERARDALTRLVASGVLACNEGWLWLA